MSQAAKPTRLIFFLLILYGLALALYFVARYGGQWAETDTNSITRMVSAMQSEGRLVPQSAAYQHGFLYTVVSVFLADLSGVPVGELQRLVYPFVGILFLVVTVMMFYQQATGDARPAALAVLLLCFQPDVLFVILRGSHEKLDWPLMMVSLALLYLSIGQSARKQVAYLLLFYLLVFAQVTTNVYFASTFLAAVALGLLAGVMVSAFLGSRRSEAEPGIDRLLYITLSGGILLYLFIEYIYPLAERNIRLVGDIFDQVSAMLLSFEPVSQPYQYISFGWIDSRVYLGLTAFTWLLVAASLAEWFYRLWRILAGREAFNLQNSLDWMLYAGFALQVGLSVVVDFSGALSSNLQLRVFPGFTILACLLVAKSLWRVGSSSPMLQKRQVSAARIIAGAVVAVLCAWFAVAALFKASNEPLLSNKWSFYTQDELAAIDWGVLHLQNTSLWVSLDERLWEAYMITHSNKIPGGNQLLTHLYDERCQYVIVSTREQLRTRRTGFSMPDLSGWLLVYDNGDTQLYHQPMITPP